MAALVFLAVISTFMLGIAPLMTSEVNSLTPPSSDITVELKFTDAQGQAKHSFTESESVHVIMLVRNYDPELDPDAVLIIQVKGLEDDIVYHLDWKQGRYPYAAEVQHVFEIPPLGQPDQYFVIVHVWSNLDNPEVSGDSARSLLRIES